ncbi:MAG: phage portal protein [Geobacteraceae bacterium]
MVSVLDRIGSGIDRTVGVLFPRTEYNRRLARAASARVRQYAAAKVTRLTGDWIPANQDINSLIRSSSPTIRARSRQLVRDFPFFARAVNVLTNYTVGTGIRFQSRVIDEAASTDKKTVFDKRAIRQIEDAISWAMDELEASGGPSRRLHGHELERLAKRQDTESGEYLFVKQWSNEPNRYIPFCLQAYEADWLTSSYTTLADGNNIDQGIEFDPKTGRVVAYHFAVPSGFNSLTGSTRSQRIAAEHVIHDFHTQRPGQLRGISPFTTAILVAHDLGDYLDAEIDGAKMAAKYLAFVSSPDISGFQGLRTETDSETGQKLESIENAIIEYLRPGEKVDLASHNRPGDSFVPFTQFVLRMVAVATDTTYELLTSDYSGLSYSNFKGIRNDFAVMMRPHAQRHILHLSTPVVREIITSAVLRGRIDLPGYFKNPWRYWRGVFTPPGMESIDPLREGKAWIDQIRATLRSPQEITSARGRDYEEVLDELAEAKAMAEERGLTWEDVSTALKQNPAAMGATEEGE